MARQRRAPLPDERKNVILDTLEREGRVVVADLAAQLNVSEMTIRRDLSDLERLGVLRRVHGAAVSARSEDYDPSFWVRASRSRAEKRAIGREAAKLVNDGEVIAIDVGTTALEVARHITCENVVVVTPSPHVAFCLVQRGISNVFLTGGMVRRKTLTLTGPLAVQSVANFNIRKAFIGTAGVTARFSFTEHSPEEAEVKRALIAKTEEVILVADHTKFGRGGFVEIGPLTLVHRVITNEPAPPDLIEYTSRNGIALTVARLG